MINKKRSKPASRFLSEDECQELMQRAVSLAVGGGDTALMIEGTWKGNLRYARNNISTTGDIRSNSVVGMRDVRGAIAYVYGNQIDDIGLEAAIRRAERLVRLYPETGDRRFREHFVKIDESGKREVTSSEGNGSEGLEALETPLLLMQTIEPHAKPSIFFDTTYNLQAQQRTEEIQPLLELARRDNLMAAGYVEVSAHGRAVMDTWGRSIYYPYTRSQFSVTVRDPDGTGSGWAGIDFNDWERIDPLELSNIAIDKCLRSRNSVAVEPGRYTAILEPQAVCDIFSPVVWALDRQTAEAGSGPFALSQDQSRIGLKVLDERITLSADPMDPDLGFPPFDRSGNVYHPVNWIENGVLKELSYLRSFGIQKLGRNSGLPNSMSYRLSGSDTTIQEMITTTKRGLLVTRFHGIKVINKNSLLCSGYTRDGLWLVENGKISRAVRNFRITESPLFIFNNLESLGEPVRTFRPGAPTVVPPAKVRDFSFTSLSDAV